MLHPMYLPPGNSSQVISSFVDEYGFLSNFHPCLIQMGQVKFTSSEQAYHWHKLANPEDREKILKLATAWEAKKFSRKCLILPDWDDLRTGVMLSVLILKFEQNLDLKLKLLDTKPAILMEGNHWNDTFWGCVWKGEDQGGWIGSNHLGRILMLIRDTL